jgi:hypothetical protein
VTARCQFPTGDPGHPDYRVCGAPVAQSRSPYCSEHSAIAYRRERRAPRLRHSRRPLICLTTPDEG